MRNSIEIARQRRDISAAKNAPFWGSVNFFVMIIFMIELKCSFMSQFVEQYFLNKLLTYCEFTFLFLFMINTIHNLYLFVWLKNMMQPIELSPREYELFGIGEDEIGFVLEDQDKKQRDSIDKNSSIKKYMPKFEMNNSYPLLVNTSLDSSAQHSKCLLDSSLNSTGASWSFHNGAFKDSFNASLKNNNSFNNSANDSGLRFRKNNSFVLNSSLKNSSKAAIKSDEELKSFLQSYDEKTEQVSELLQSQKRFSSSMVDGNTSNTNISHNMTNNSLNTSNISQHNFQHQEQNSSLNINNNSPNCSSNNFATYQPSIKVSSGGNPIIDKNVSVIFNHQNPKELEKILNILNVNEASLTQMVENIRKWISQTILVRLSEQIDVVNKQIKSKGYIEGIVGETAIQQLKNFAQSKEKEFPSLIQIYAFLNLQSKNMENSVVTQQYLVRRIKDLSKGGCISDYIWNGGGTYNYKAWKDDLPTDAELLLHLFAVYLDSRILFNPALPEGKPFTSQFIKFLNSSTSPKSDTYIEQTSSNPPHYCVVLKKVKHDLPGGRNNLFYAILVFLNHIQTTNFGLLGRINLSSSGLNISWVINNALKQ